MTIQNLPEVELNQLAKDYYAGRIFTDRDCGSEHQITSCFIPIAPLSPDQAAEILDVALIYEHCDEALPNIGINGKPVFSSCHLLNQHDLGLLAQKVKAITEAVEKAVGNGN